MVARREGGRGRAAQRQTSSWSAAGRSACAAPSSWPRAGARTILLERETEVCPPVSGAHANCGLLVPSDATPLAAPGVLGQGLRWMLDSSSPFYIAPRPSPALARWLWLFRAACSRERAEAAAPVLRALHVASARLHDELAAEHGDSWHFHHDGELQVFETASRARGRARGRGTSARPGRAHRRGDGRRRPGGSSRACAASSPARSSSRRTATWTRCASRGRWPGWPRRPARRSSTGAEVLTLEAGARRRARGDDARRRRRRPGRAGGRRLDAAAHPRARPAPADRAGQGLQRGRGAAGGLPRAAAVSGRRPRRPHTAGRHAASGKHSGAVRLGHARAPQAGGSSARGRPARDRPAGRRPGAPALARPPPGDARTACR